MVPAPPDNPAFDPDDRYHVTFVCTGNICRSPMAEVIFQHRLEEEGLEDQVRTNSCGLGGWHVGQGADKRAVAELRSAGLDGSHHRAAQLGNEHTGADLVIALDNGHFESLRGKGIDSDRLRLLRSFDPNSPQGADVDDPYYGNVDGFTRTRQEIEASMDGLIEFIRSELATR